jgi:hypothetical protein
VRDVFCAGLHEDLERLERVIVKDYKQDAKGHKEKLMQVIINCYCYCYRYFQLSTEKGYMPTM